MFARITTTITFYLALAAAGQLDIARDDFPMHGLDAVAPSVLRIDARQCQGNVQAAAPMDRVATGFLWRDKNTAVTALHVVTGCPNISVYYQGLKISRSATITKVLRKADLALLSVGNSPESTPLQDDAKKPSLDQELATLGFQLQIPDMSSTLLHLRYGGKKLRDIVPPSVAQALANVGSPSLDLEITNIEGHLVPGLSGAPIFNPSGKVVAVADGGLDNGTVGISWGIPIGTLHDLTVSSESISEVANGARNDVLFAAERDSSVKGQQNCSGLQLTKLRTTSFSQIASSADDVLGLQQLINYFQIDPAGFSFDVYQHLPSGATIALPSGSQLTVTQGVCTATLGNGEVVIMVQLALLASDAEIQAESQQLELNAAGGSVQGWYIDPGFTYPMPVPRFDGMLVRRRGYVHLTAAQIGLNQVPQDKYLFETIAARGHAMLFTSVTNNAATTSNNQRALACRLNPAQEDCAAILSRSSDWVRSVIAVHLATFPVG
jgi:S1-C subfamily serine protease